MSFDNENSSERALVLKRRSVSPPALHTYAGTQRNIQVKDHSKQQDLDPPAAPFLHSRRDQRTDQMSYPESLRNLHNTSQGSQQRTHRSKDLIERTISIDSC
jgi:hypothetical protein